MASIPNSDVWREFFAVYRALPSLYAVKDGTLKNKKQKQKDWDTLLKKYKKIDPNSTLSQLKSKLHNIKFCYRRELKKVENSIRSRSAPDEKYVTNLWYFDELKFLRDHKKKQQQGQSSMQTRIDTSHYNSDAVKLTYDMNTLSKPKKPKARITNELLAEKYVLLKDTLSAIQTENPKRDEFDIYADNWAVLFRKLSSSQQTFAKKAIEDVLFLAQLSQLSIATIQALSPTSSSLSSSPLPSPSCISRVSTPEFQYLQLPQNDRFVSLRTLSRNNESETENCNGEEYENVPPLFADEQYSNYEFSP